MKQTLNKLKSNTGSTLLLALLFMLICVFVGGSVLVAATVNGGRLSGRREEQQALLEQRSIASIIVSELSENDKVALSLQKTADDMNCIIPGDAPVLQQLIFQSAQKALMGKDDTTVPFTVTGPEGERISCRVECDVRNYNIFIRFDDSPQIRMKLYGRASDDKITWYKAVIEKDGAQ